MTATIIHPGVLTAIRRFFGALATIQVKTVTLDGYGQEVDTWADVVSLKQIPATKAPLSASERQAAQFTVTDQSWSVLLFGAYPAITTKHRAVVDGVVYDIDAAETDQTGSLTRLRVRTVEV